MKQLHRTRISNPKVALVFKKYPRPVAAFLKYIRKLIVEVAREIKDVGVLEETLKWGEPSYLTSETKAGSTIRLDWKREEPDFVFVFFKCTSNLVEAFRKRYRTDFEYVGNRAIKISLGEKIDENKFKNCVALALTYHKNKKYSPKARWSFVENR